MLVLPTITAPSSWRSLTTVASYGLVKSFNILEDAVVFKLFVQMLSFIAIGLSLMLREAGLDSAALSRAARSDGETSELKTLKCLYLDWFSRYVLAYLESDMEGESHHCRGLEV